MLAAFGAGWYTLDVATKGSPGLYLYGATTLTGLAIVYLLLAGGMGMAIYAGIYAATKMFAAGLDAAFLCLRTAVEYAIGLLARRLRG